MKYQLDNNDIATPKLIGKLINFIWNAETSSTSDGGPRFSNLENVFHTRRITKGAETSNPVIRSFIASFDVAHYKCRQCLHQFGSACRHFLV